MSALGRVRWTYRLAVTTAAAWLLACAVTGLRPAVAAADSSLRPLQVDWRMPDTYGSAELRDAQGLPEATPPSEVGNGPWHVDLEVPGCDPAASYSWSVDGRPIAPKRRGCAFSAYAFPTLGRYTVEVRTTIAGQQYEGREKIAVEDWLIVSLGDSVASGEGVPERNAHDRERARWQNLRCHRSAYAGPALAAERLAREHPHVQVTFVHLACSGATIARGLIGGYAGIVDKRPPELPAQVAELNRLKREPTVVLISIGANDVGFSDFVKACIAVPHGRLSCFGGPAGFVLRRRLARLPGQYDLLRTKIDVGAPIYLTEYFDPTGNANGEPCKQAIRLGKLGFRFNERDLRDAYDKLLAPLNGSIAAAVARFRAFGDSRWREVTGMADAFRRHGVCTDDQQRWITNERETLERQGSLLHPIESAQGLLHPNKRGHEAIAAKIDAALELAAQPACALEARTSATAAADPPPGDPPGAVAASAPPCLTPQAIALPLQPQVRTGGLSAPLWILIGLGIVAALALSSLALARSRARAAELAPIVLLALIGAALLDLGVELVDHAAPAVVLLAAGAAALAAASALLARRPPVSARAAASRIGLSARARRVSFAVAMKDLKTENLVVVGLGAALIVFFAGVSAAVVAGHMPPSAMWAAGAAVTGALVGLLAPAPGAKGRHEAAAERATERAANADKAATDKAAAPGGLPDDEAKELAEKAQKAREEAADHKAAAMTTPETKLAVIALLVALPLLVALAVVLSLGVIDTGHEFAESVKNITAAVIALASASGSALIGLLAPGPKG